MRPGYRASVAAGVLSGALFFVVASLGLGFLLLFIPTLPLLYVGLGTSPRASVIASLCAAALIALLTGFANSLFFLAVFALPTYVFCAQALKRSASGEWFPAGLILLHLTAFACIPMALVTYHYASLDGGVERVLSDQLQSELSDVSPEYNNSMQQITTRFAFLVFAVTVWLWSVTLYFHAWIANRLLARNKAQIRDSVAITPFAMPNWILSLLAIAALASLIGSPPMQFLGKVCFVALLFPYILLGVAIMHHASKTWPSRGFFLFFIYLMLIAQFWPALILAGIGFFSHIKRLSGAQTSSKS